MITPKFKSRKRFGLWKSSRSAARIEESLLLEDGFRSDQQEEEIVFEGGFKQEEIMNDGFALGVFDLSQHSLRDSRDPLHVKPEILPGVSDERHVSEHTSSSPDDDVSDILSDLDSLAEILDQELRGGTDQSDIWIGVKAESEDPIFFDPSSPADDDGDQSSMQLGSLLSQNLVVKRRSRSRQNNRAVPKLFNRKQRSSENQPWRKRLVKSRKIAAGDMKPVHYSNGQIAKTFQPKNFGGSDRPIELSTTEKSPTEPKPIKQKKIKTKIECVVTAPIQTVRHTDSPKKPVESVRREEGQEAISSSAPAKTVKPGRSRQLHTNTSAEKCLIDEKPITPLRRYTMEESEVLQTKRKTKLPKKNNNYKKQNGLTGRIHEKLAKSKPQKQIESREPQNSSSKYSPPKGKTVTKETRVSTPSSPSISMWDRLLEA